MKTLSFIAAGRITNIILQAFKNAGIHFKKIVFFDLKEDLLKSLKRRFSHIQMAPFFEETVNADLIFLAKGVNPVAFSASFDSIKKRPYLT